MHQRDELEALRSAKVLRLRVSALACLVVCSNLVGAGVKMCKLPWHSLVVTAKSKVAGPCTPQLGSYCRHWQAGDHCGPVRRAQANNPGRNEAARGQASQPTNS